MSILQLVPPPPGKGSNVLKEMSAKITSTVKDISAISDVLLEQKVVKQTSVEQITDAPSEEQIPILINVGSGAVPSVLCFPHPGCP